jgi:regulator of replication initiation timing
MSDQAPNACPFCGAARKPACRFAWFQCGTMTAPGDNNRRDQTPTCATAERERLTRDRDDLATKATALAVQVAELTRELEGHAHDLSPAMVQARNDQLNAENAKLQERIRTLEAQTLADSKELRKQDADTVRLICERNDWKRCAELLHSTHLPDNAAGERMFMELEAKP